MSVTLTYQMEKLSDSFRLWIEMFTWDYTCYLLQWEFVLQNWWNLFSTPNYIRWILLYSDVWDLSKQMRSVTMFTPRFDLLTLNESSWWTCPLMYKGRCIDIVFVVLCYWRIDMLSMCNFWFFPFFWVGVLHTYTSGILLIMYILFLPSHIPGPLMFHIREATVAY